MKRTMNAKATAPLVLQMNHSMEHNYASIYPKVANTRKRSSVRSAGAAKQMKYRNNFDEDFSLQKLLESTASSSKGSTPVTVYGNGRRDYATDQEKIKVKEPKVDKTKKTTIDLIMSSLAAAIINGEQDNAATFAKELARMKVLLSITRPKVPNFQSQNEDCHKSMRMDLIVEEEESSGTITLRMVRVKPEMTVTNLKELIQKDFDYPILRQKLVYKDTLITDDKKPLEEYGIVDNTSPLKLFVTETEASQDVMGDNEKDFPPKTMIEKHYIADLDLIFITNSDDEDEEIPKPIVDLSDGAMALRKPPSPEDSIDVKPTWTCPLCTFINSNDKLACEACARTTQIDPPDHLLYLELMELDDGRHVVKNAQVFECPICFADCEPGDGVVLRDCLHSFCRECLSSTVENSEEAEIKCPYMDQTYSCDSVLQEREIRAVVTDQLYEKHLMKSLTQAESRIQNTFHCKTPNCHGWWIYENNLNLFECPVCHIANCLTCKAIHTGMNCHEYRYQLEYASGANVDVLRSRQMLDAMLIAREAMNCPTCQMIVMKDLGCDYLKCSMCKTDICWATRGPRWGPAGPGDTSGGCRCNQFGRKCHPKCNNCH